MATGDCSILYNRCKASEINRLIQRLVILLEHPITKTHLDRNIELLDELLKVTKYAFWMKDLPYVTRLLEIILEKKQEFPIFESYFSRILTICSIPPLQEKSSEGVYFNVHLKEFFNVLGYFLITLKGEYQNLVIYVINSLITRKTVELENCVSENCCRTAIESSNLIEAVVHLFLDADDDLYEKLLELSLKIAKKSQIVCQKMIKSALTPLMLRFYPNWRDCNEDDRFDVEIDASNIENYFTVTKLLTLLLDSVKTNRLQFENAMEMPPIVAVKNFLRVLKMYTKCRGFQVERNTVMGIFLKLINLYPSLPEYSQCGLVDDVALLSVATEMGTAGTWAASVKFYADERDYDFKRMLLLTLCIIKSNTINHIQQRKVIPGILRIITPGLSISWPPDYYCNLLHLSFYILRISIKNLTEEFIQNNGPVRILMIVEYYTVKPYSEDILISALHFLNFLAETKIHGIIEIMQKHHLSDILIRIWKYFMDNNLSQISYKCIMYLLLILSSLENQRYDKDVIQLHLNLLKRSLNPMKNDSMFYETSLIPALKLLWDIITENYELNDYFLSQGGIFILLDVANKFSLSVKLVALGLLVDLCEEGSCIPFLVTWRSHGKTFLNLLIDIYMEENKKLQVKTDSKGVMQDMEWPISGCKQKAEILRKEKDPNCSPSIIDIIASCRPKIYAILRILSYTHDEKVEICNEHYHIFNRKKSLNDQVVLLQAENYFLLKLGEVWSEVKIDLDNLGIKPIQMDELLLDNIIKNYKNWCVHIKNAQEEIIKQEYFKEQIEEKELYLLLKEAHLQDSFKALVELKLLARSTEIIFRIKAIQRQRKALGLENLPIGKWLFNIQVKPIYKQQLKITLDETKTEKRLDLDEVSESHSSENICNLKEHDEEYYSD